MHHVNCKERDTTPFPTRDHTCDTFRRPLTHGSCVAEHHASCTTYSSTRDSGSNTYVASCLFPIRGTSPRAFIFYYLLHLSSMHAYLDYKVINCNSSLTLWSQAQESSLRRRPADAFAPESPAAASFVDV